MELCGGELADLSQLELLKRDDLKFQVLDDEDYSDDISNELSELDNFDDDDEDYVPESLRNFLEDANNQLEKDLDDIMHFEKHDTDYMEPCEPKEWDPL